MGFYLKSFVLCAAITIVLGHNVCHDNAWENVGSLTKCCKSIKTSTLEAMKSTAIGEKCTVDPEIDEDLMIKCILKEEGIFPGEKINSAGMIALALRSYDELVWTRSVTGSVKICMDKMVGKSHPEDFFLDCLDIYLFANCPKTEWTDSESCVATRKNLIVCV